MRKRMWKLCAATAVLSSVTFPGLAQAACGQGPPGGYGSLRWPADGAITGAWSLDCSLDRGHRGIDIGATAGSKVSAAAAGTVSFIGYTPAEGGGTTVTITHAGGMRSVYLHMGQVAVAEGQAVSAGEQIGVLAGPYLHFGLKSDPAGSRELYYNPLDLLPPRPAGTQSSSLMPEGEVREPVAGDGATTPEGPAPAAQPVTGPVADTPAETAAGDLPAGHPALSPDRSGVQTAWEPGVNPARDRLNPASLSMQRSGTPPLARFSPGAPTAGAAGTGKQAVVSVPESEWPGSAPAVASRRPWPMRMFSAAGALLLVLGASLLSTKWGKVSAGGAPEPTECQLPYASASSQLS